MFKRLLNRKIKHSVFTETSQENFASPTDPVIPLPYTLRRSCKDVSIDEFIQAYCHSNLSVLIVVGHPPQDVVLECWNEILFEYANLLKSDSSQYIFDLHKQISELQFDIWYVNEVINVLRVRYEQDLVDELIKMGYDGDFTQEETLERTISLAKTKVYDLELLIAEYNALHKVIEGKKQTEEEFESSVAWLSKFQSYYIDTKTTSIYKFTIIFNNYVKYGRKQPRQD